MNFQSIGELRPYRSCLTNIAFNTDAYAKAGGIHLFATDIRNNVIRVFDNKCKDETDTSFSDSGQRRPSASVQYS